MTVSLSSRTLLLLLLLPDGDQCKHYSFQ